MNSSSNLGRVLQEGYDGSCWTTHQGPYHCEEHGNSSMGCQPMHPWTYTFSLRYWPDWGLNPGLLGYIPGALPLSYLAMALVTPARSYRTRYEDNSQETVYMVLFDQAHTVESLWNTFTCKRIICDEPVTTDCTLLSSLRVFSDTFF